MATKSKFDPKNMQVLVSAERRRAIDTHSLLSRLPIRPHHVVADIGCGPGYFAVPFAKYLYDGKVFALDIQQEMLDATQKKMDDTRLTTVEVMLSKERKLPLDDESVDGALMAFVLQEADGPAALLKEARRCLKPAGWLAVLEWHKRETEQGPPIGRRIDPDAMRAMGVKLGLKAGDTQQLNDSQYMMVMRK
jgi:ubiquinone/menaquinone biosynthesis C-methylase UbiE